MGHVLFGVESRGIDLAARHQRRRDAGLGPGENRLHGARRLVEMAHQMGHANRLSSFRFPLPP